jgi:hypothetical protein
VRLCPTIVFQGINPELTQLLGKITPPFTFSNPENYNTDNITFDPGETRIGKVNEGIHLCIQRPEGPYTMGNEHDSA